MFSQVYKPLKPRKVTCSGGWRHRARAPTRRRKLTLMLDSKPLRFRLFFVLLPLLLVFLVTACSTGLTAVDGSKEPSVAVATLTPLAPTSSPRSAVSVTPSPPPAASVTPSPPPPTVTPGPTIEPIRFAVIGDYGSPRSGADEVAALVDSWDPDFILTTGDNNYPEGAADTLDANVGARYGEWFAPPADDPSLPTRFFPTLGNHDWRADGAWPYLDYFDLPGNERYYDFVWGPVHFFALDSDPAEPDGNEPGSIQARWLEARLAASRSPWQVVYMHHPPFSSGANGSTWWMQWPFAEWGADVVLSGHDHDYERIMGDDGLPYFVNGLGGHTIYQFAPRIEGSEAIYNEAHGAMYVDASAEQLFFQFVTVEGEIIDTHTIRADRR